jgi:hypothetical protein
MGDSETSVVYKILGVLAAARNLGHGLPIHEIADAARIGRPSVEHYLNLLKHAGAVRAEVNSAQTAEYCLTQYGCDRLVGGRGRASRLNRRDEGQFRFTLSVPRPVGPA